MYVYWLACFFSLLLYIDDLCFITFILPICPFLSVDTVSFLFLPLFKLACLMPPQKWHLATAMRLILKQIKACLWLDLKTKIRLVSILYMYATFLSNAFNKEIICKLIYKKLIFYFFTALLGKFRFTELLSKLLGLLFNFELIFADLQIFC